MYLDSVNKSTFCQGFRHYFLALDLTDFVFVERYESQCHNGYSSGVPWDIGFHTFKFTPGVGVRCYHYNGDAWRNFTEYSIPGPITVTSHDDVVSKSPTILLFDEHLAHAKKTTTYCISDERWPVNSHHKCQIIRVSIKRLFVQGRVQANNNEIHNFAHHLVPTINTDDAKIAMQS